MIQRQALQKINTRVLHERFQEIILKKNNFTKTTNCEGRPIYRNFHVIYDNI